MATLTIRNVPDDVKHALRVKAAQNGRSLEDALRQLLSDDARDANQPTSRIDAAEILRRAAKVQTDEPQDLRFRYFTQKELSDAISGEFDQL